MDSRLRGVTVNTECTFTVLTMDSRLRGSDGDDGGCDEGGWDEGGWDEGGWDEGGCNDGDGTPSLEMGFRLRVV